MKKKSFGWHVFFSKQMENLIVSEKKARKHLRMKQKKTKTKKER
jgi:hypothetical protein